MNEKQHIPEAVLSRIWQEQCFREDCLHTLDGQDIYVIRRGRRNTDSGPDFKGALIRIGERIWEGDVELHLRLRDWHGHGHERDPAYNLTMLHVVLWPPSQNGYRSHESIRTANGKIIPTVVVHACLSHPLEDLIQAFQRTDERKRSKIQRCYINVQRLPFNERLTKLRQTGLERLHERARRFEDRLKQNCFRQVLYAAICEGLGYSGNTRPFAELARRLPLDVLLAHLPRSFEPSRAELHWIQALLFGVSGLLTSPHHHADTQTEQYLETLSGLWKMLAPCLDVKPMPAEVWHFFRLRPPNFPTRRLTALSYLARNYRHQALFDGYLSIFKFFAGHPDCVSRKIRILEQSLQIPAAGYWKGRYRFGPAVFCAKDHFFLGNSRVRDIIISAVFPVFFLYARQNADFALESEILTLYDAFPAPARNRISTSIATQLFTPEERASSDLRVAATYQGMLHLHQHYCALLACASCPFGNAKNI